MAQSVPVQLMPEFNPDAEVGASVATRWTTWLSDFEMFLLASGITDTEHQQTLLLYTSTLPDQGSEKFLNKFPTTEKTTISRLQRRNSPNTFSHKLTAGMKLTGSARPNKIKKNHWTNSSLAHEQSLKIVNFQKIIWNSISNNKFWYILKNP